MLAPRGWVWEAWTRWGPEGPGAQPVTLYLPTGREESQAKAPPMAVSAWEVWVPTPT